MKLKWCEECNLPLVGKRCSICGSEGKHVDITPPGDIRPAFEYDLEMIRHLADEQFGEGCGKLFAPADKVFILNRAPGEDRIDEIISDGTVIGSLKYEIFTGKFILSPRVEGAVRMLPALKRSWVIVDEGAVEPILKSANALAVGVNEMSDDMKKGDEVVVLSPEKEVIAVGRAMMSGEEMENAERGVGIKVRHRLKEPVRIPDGGQDWDAVIKANTDAVRKNISKGIEFVKKVVEDNDSPLVASYSGGKDSLAALLIALDAGYKPVLMFLNTGIEMPETIENARRTAERYGLEYQEIDAGDAFWNGLEIFGPPAKDYRWCCKACKLGPTTLFIKERYPDGMISLIGQRKYESESRSRKGNEWENPWVRKQKGISPIQDWTALEVWLYLFMKGADYNPWYERGLYRIGCYLCPSADMGDTVILKENFDGYARWDDYLTEYARDKGLEDEWLKYGLWRWRRFPPWARSRGFHAPELKRGKGGVSFEDGNPVITSVPVDTERMKAFASILGEWTEKDGSIEIKDVCTIAGDEITIHDESFIRDIKGVVEQAVNCMGCGVCVGRCPTGALSIKNGMAVADPETCVHCRECLRGPCPARDFNLIDIY